MEITAWLRSLGLDRYAAAFRANDIDMNILPQLTAEDLTGLGVVSIGHRRKLLNAVAMLHPESLPAGTPATSGSDNGPDEPRAPTAVEAERRQLTVVFCDLEAVMHLEHYPTKLDRQNRDSQRETDERVCFQA
jgi:hypothetical protein